MKIYKYITQDFFTQTASSYLKCSPQLVQLKILISPANDLSKKLSGSQEWHSDFDDENNLKLFIYLDNVDKKNGPLELIDKKTSKKILNNSNYKWGKKTLIAIK